MFISLDSAFCVVFLLFKKKINYRIDHAHHSTQPHISLEETLEFDRAIALARRKLSDEDTLIVVSSDHSHTMTYAGYGVDSFTVLVLIKVLQYLNEFRNVEQIYSVLVD